MVGSTLKSALKIQWFPIWRRKTELDFGRGRHVSICPGVLFIATADWMIFIVGHKRVIEDHVCRT
jgi:hypothetical protein